MVKKRRWLKNQGSTAHALHCILFLDYFIEELYNFKQTSKNTFDLNS